DSVLRLWAAVPTEAVSRRLAPLAALLGRTDETAGLLAAAEVAPGRLPAGAASAYGAAFAAATLGACSRMDSTWQRLRREIASTFAVNEQETELARWGRTISRFAATCPGRRLASDLSSAAPV